VSHKGSVTHWHKASSRSDGLGVGRGQREAGPDVSPLGASAQAKLILMKEVCLFPSS